MHGALSPRGPANRAPTRRASKERLRLRSTAATRGACLSNVPRCAQARCWGAPLPPRPTSLRREVFARSLRRVLQASAARTNRLYSCQSTRSPRLLAAVIFKYFLSCRFASSRNFFASVTVCRTPVQPHCLGSALGCGDSPARPRLFIATMISAGGPAPKATMH